LFLASLFGAELTAPKSLEEHVYNFYCPVLSMNKEPGYQESGFRFMEDLACLLRDFGVSAVKISSRQEFVGKEREPRVRIRLILSSTPESLLNLWEKVGFEYSENKSFLANAGALYLRRKSLVIHEKKRSEALASIMKSEGYSLESICALAATSPLVSRRFIERSLYEGRKTSPRIWGSSDTWTAGREQARESLGSSGFLFDAVTEVATIPFKGRVYDFTVDHPDHNFVADGFLVSNCGVRLLRTNLEMKDIEHRKEDLLTALFQAIPSGVGSTGKVNLKKRVLEEVLVEGAAWPAAHGFGDAGDLDNIEEHGCLEGADPEALSDRAIERGLDQLETLGSGNHFVEIQQVTEVYDQPAAGVFGLFPGQIVVMVHTGSRGLGYQVCDDFLSQFGKAVAKYGISVPDRQLVCAPAGSYEGKKYFSAMKCAANYAFANRQIIGHWIRDTFMKVLRLAPNDLGMLTVYDVAHNMCKLETHLVDGNRKKLYVHRKGATRAFPAGHPDLPDHYQPVGQPVIIPGSMGTASYVLVGTEKAMAETWGSTCHGAGRNMSRTQAIKEARGRSIADELAQKGILARAESRLGLAEEMPKAYKDIDEVIRTVEGAGLSRKVARMVPLAVMKG